MPCPAPPWHDSLPYRCQATQLSCRWSFGCTARTALQVGRSPPLPSGAPPLAVCWPSQATAIRPRRVRRRLQCMALWCLQHLPCHSPAPSRPPHSTCPLRCAALYWCCAMLYCSHPLRHREGHIHPRWVWAGARPWAGRCVWGGAVHDAPALPCGMCSWATYLGWNRPRVEGGGHQVAECATQARQQSMIRAHRNPPPPSRSRLCRCHRRGQWRRRRAFLIV